MQMSSWARDSEMKKFRQIGFMHRTGYAVVGALVLILVAWVVKTSSTKDAKPKVESANTTTISSPESGMSGINNGSDDTFISGSSSEYTTVPKSESDSDSEPTLDPDKELAPSGKSVSQSLPFVGMDVRLINKTGLGASSSAAKKMTSGRYRGAYYYYWAADSGDVIYEAYSKDYKIIDVAYRNRDTDYWRDENGELRSLPDRSGTGVERKAKKIYGTSKPENKLIELLDPWDYDSPEDYADDAEEYFRAQGSKDPWGDAFGYWENEVE
ncbi:hypothetical protein HMPREF9069_00099 [Atopobium sp. oral taxon 810 str. F0209]|nr:hypothetical protein HMPREF9069_00099 [Atopobium sp. oral taxon 810 str. F0209]